MRNQSFPRSAARLAVALALAALVPSFALATTSLSSTGIVTDSLTVNGSMGIGVSSPGARLEIDTGAPGNTGLLLKSAASQTAKLFELQDSTGTRQFAISVASPAVLEFGPASDVNLYRAGTNTLQTDNDLVAKGTLTSSTATATDDKLTVAAPSGGAGSFTGTISSADLTGNVGWNFPAVGGGVVIDSATQTLTNKTLTSPLINGGSITGASVIGLTDGLSHVLTFQTKSVLPANGSLQISFPLSTTFDLGGNFATASGFTTFGNFPLTLNVTGLTGITLPTSGTLSTLTGSETLTNKTLTSPVISTISNTGTLTLPTSTDTLVGRATADTLTNKTLTAPRISGIKDLNGNDILQFNATASAVNGFQIFNAPTGLGPTLMVVGADANADMRIQAKGTGGFLFLNPTANADMIKIQPQSAGSSTFQGTLTTADLTGNRTWTLPDTAGTIALLSDVVASGITGTGASNGVAFWTGASALSNDTSNFNWDNATKRLGLVDPSPSATLSIGAGHKLTVDASTGNLVSVGTVIAAKHATNSICVSNTTPANCVAASAGSVTIDAAATTTLIQTSAVTAQSQILVTEDPSLSLGVTCNTVPGRTYAITSRAAGTSFTITSSVAPVTNPACLSFLIVN